MKRVFLSVICIVFAIALTAASVVNASAATATTSSMSLSASTVNVDKTFTVTVKTSSSVKIGSLMGSVKYDSAIISFVSSSYANGAAGNVVVSKYDANNTEKSISVSMTFKALKAGTCTLSFSSSEVADIDGTVLGNSSASAKVTVKDNTVVLSNNADLTSLKLSSGTLSPSFSKSTVSYTATVPYSVTTVTMSVTTAEKDAKVEVSGSSSMKVGKNTRSVTVTAPDGTTKKTYTVVITRKADTSSSSASSSSVSSATSSTSSDNVSSAASSTVSSGTESTVDDALKVIVDGNEMIIAENIEGVKIPKGFIRIAYTYNSVAVPAVTNAENTVTMLYLTGGKSGFYIYDEGSMSFSIYNKITVGNAAIILLEKPRNIAVPNGFVRASVNINDTEIEKCWKYSTENGDYYLIYAAGASGYTGFYLYDAAEQTMQRYLPFESAVQTAVTNTKNSGGLLEGINLYILAAAAVLLITVVVLATVLGVKTHKVKKDSGDILLGGHRK